MFKQIPLSRSIAVRLLRYVFTIYFTLTLIITTTHAVIEYQHTKEKVCSELKDIEKTFTPALTTALWNLNNKQLEAISRGIMNLPAIVALKIYDANGKALIEIRDALRSEGRAMDESYTHSFDIIQSLKDDDFYLATVIFHTGSKVVFERIKFGFIIIIVNAVIKSIILWLLFLWIFKMLLFRPFQEFTREISSVDLEHLDGHRIDLGLQHSDELQLLEKVFNHMLTKLGAEKLALMESQQQQQRMLEQRVLERTYELEIANQQLNYFATTDPLTHTHNRRSFFEHSIKYLAIAIRNRQPLSLLMLDIDHFKKINDTYGHAAGDAILKNFSRVVSCLIRDGDLFARFGGEEFVILLNNTYATGAQTLSEKILMAVSGMVTQYDGKKLQVTVSIGVAELSNNDRDIEALVSRADCALYRAKNDGRNCFSLFP